MDNFDLRKYLAEGRLFKEAQDMDAAKTFLENKGLEVEYVKSGNEGNDKASSVLKDKALIWNGEGMKYEGKEYFMVYIPYDKELKEEIKSKFPVLDVGGKTGRYFDLTIEK